MIKEKKGVVIERQGEYLTDEWFARWDKDISKAKVFDPEHIKYPSCVIPHKLDRGTIHERVNYDEINEGKLVNITIKTEYHLK